MRRRAERVRSAMAGCARGGGRTRLRDGWLAPAAEAAAYERLRRGDEAAFRAVAEPLQPTLRRLAALTVDTPAAIDARAARTWEVALGGLDMFHWQTPFATWVAGLAVTLGRCGADPSPNPAAPLPRTRPAQTLPAQTLPARTVAGPDDWSDLPWAERWGRSWEALPAAMVALPLTERETVHAREVERWPPRRVCDVLGLTETRYGALLADGRTRLRGSLAGLVAAPPAAGPFLDAQSDAVARMLRETTAARDGPLDAGTLAAFRRWRARRRWHWRLLHHRGLAGSSR